MASVDYPEPVRALIVHLKQLPGIGPKSAERIAVWLLQRGPDVTGPFSDMLARAGSEVIECGTCGFFATEADGCSICDALQRDESSLCVVEQPTDILPLERSGAFRGHYHSLRGRISPLDGVGPEDLRIGELLERLRSGAFTEIIVALSSDVEGEATANYLAEILREFEGVAVSRLAQGMPAGGGLDSADELTLMRALQGRTGLR
ncbi:MAG: recombination mediator RecR [Verrucomicrobiales bacterium]|nr:recombination mediator RecR [Verrucomicrobiales bacterium]